MLWFVYTLILALTFVEPQRSGLKEQRWNEHLQSMAGSATNVPPESNNDSCPHSEVEMSNLDPSKDHRFIQESYSFSTENGQDRIDKKMESTRYKITNASPEPIVSSPPSTLWQQPVRLSLILLFTKMFTVESAISSVAIVTKNRYLWAVQHVGTLGTIVWCLTIPISVFIGWASQYREDRVIMLWLIPFATFGMGLFDVSDFYRQRLKRTMKGMHLRWDRVGTL